MADYALHTSPDEDTALAWAAGTEDPASYLDARIHALLKGYLDEYRLSLVVVPAATVATAYATASPTRQAAVLVALGITPTGVPA